MEIIFFKGYFKTAFEIEIIVITLLTKLNNTQS